MFSDELEMLIDAAIADGQISEKERAVLHKRAQTEGVDIDELDMIVNARISKNKKQVHSLDKVEDEKKSALQLLTESLNEISNRNYEDIKGSFWKGTTDKSAQEQREEATLGVIRSFYIPQNKEEILELIGFLKPYSKKNAVFGTNTQYEQDMVKAYKDRYKEICLKANSLFPGDEDIDVAINGPKKEKKGFFGFGKKS